MSGPVTLAGGAGSIGIRAYTEDLARALEEIGVPAKVAEGPGPDGGPVHFHYANSTRHLVGPMLSAPRPSIVTVHDVIARSKLVRPFVNLVSRAALRGHRVVVHSRHAEALLRRHGFAGVVDVIPLGVWPRRFPATETAPIREAASPDGRPILAVAGLLRRQRGAVAVLREAGGFPGFAFMFVGRPVGAGVARMLAEAPHNVTHVPEVTDTEFARHLAAADLLLNLRESTVGESSGPLAQAHAVGTPAACYDLGSAREYCGERDHLFPAGTPVGEVLRSLAAQERFGRVPESSPTVTPWLSAAHRHAEIYRELGWLG